MWPVTTKRNAKGNISKQNIFCVCLYSSPNVCDLMKCLFFEIPFLLLVSFIFFCLYLYSYVRYCKVTYDRINKVGPFQCLRFEEVAIPLPKNKKELRP